VNIFDMIGVRSVELLDFTSGCWVNLAAIGQTTNGLRREDGIRDPVLTENPDEQGGDRSCNYPTDARSAGVPHIFFPTRKARHAPQCDGLRRA
jgi:hypothetical protein